MEPCIKFYDDMYDFAGGYRVYDAAGAVVLESRTVGAAERCLAELDPEPEARPDHRAWARTAEAGDYLRTYEDSGLSAYEDPGSRCGYDDRELDETRRILADRDLRLEADDVGLVAVAVE
jgi:hypothetical protein